MLRTATSTLEVGPAPRVVATLSALPARCALAGDIVEVRLDKAGTPLGGGTSALGVRGEARYSHATGRLGEASLPQDWLAKCVELQSSGKPVLLTVRLKAEGGDWEMDGATRLAIYLEALPKLAAVDVELSSAIAPMVAGEAKRLGKATVISFHDFTKTPPAEELCEIIKRQHAIGSIAKVSTMIAQPEDVEVLRSLLRMEWPKPICVIGMGEKWSETRVEFATLGSCLTYGYLDQPTAPGQISAVELQQRLAARLNR